MTVFYLKLSLKCLEFEWFRKIPAHNLLFKKMDYNERDDLDDL